MVRPKRKTMGTKATARRALSQARCGKVFLIWYCAPFASSTENLYPKTRGMLAAAVRLLVATSTHGAAYALHARVPIAARDFNHDCHGIHSRQIIPGLRARACLASPGHRKVLIHNFQCHAARCPMDGRGIAGLAVCMRPRNITAILRNRPVQQSAGAAGCTGTSHTAGAPQQFNATSARAESCAATAHGSRRRVCVPAGANDHSRQRPASRR